MSVLLVHQRKFERWLDSSVRALPKGENMGFYRSLIQKGLTQLSSWKLKPDNFKLTITKKTTKKSHSFATSRYLWMKTKHLSKKHTLIKHKLFYAVPEYTGERTVCNTRKIRIHIHRPSLVLYFIHLVSATMYT